MTRMAAWIADPRTQVRFNGVCMAAWFLMVPVTLLVEPLRTAILYVALMSVWANFATHLGGWISALVNVRAQRVEANTDQLAHFHKIESMQQKVEKMERDHGAALSELLDLVRQAPLPEPKQPGLVFPPRPPSSDSIVGG